MDRPLWMDKGFPDICVPCQCSQKDDLRKILIIKFIGWPILWIPVSLFPQPLVSGPVNKTAMVAAIEVMYELSNIGFDSPRLAETNTESPVWHHSLGWSATYLVQIHYVGPLLLWKEQLFVLTRTDTLETDLPCLYTSLLPKLSSMNLWNSLFTIMVFHTDVTSDRETW